MQLAATYPISGFSLPSTAPERASEPVGTIWGIFARGFNIGTGSERIWIQEQRVEVVIAQKVCAGTSLAPVCTLRRIRRISGLTWEELSTAMDVSKRTLHLWDAGQALSQKHLQHLHRVAGLMERLDKGNPVHLRNLLLKDLGDQNALTLLKEGQFKQVEMQLGTEKAYPSFSELPEKDFRARIPRGVSLASYQEDQKVQIVRGKPLKSVKAPKPRKG